jgi:hypothetical protein
MDALPRLARDPALRSALLVSVLLLLYSNLTSPFEAERREEFPSFFHWIVVALMTLTVWLRS